MEMIFDTFIEEIKENGQKYIYKDSIGSEIEQTLQDIEENIHKENELDNTEKRDDRFNEFAILELNDAEADIALDMPDEFNSKIPSESKVEKIPCPQLLPNEEYYALIRGLNEEQYIYHSNFVYLLRNKPPQKMYHLINGNAGVEKSQLIKAMIQTIIRHHNLIPGHTPDDIPVVVAAYTGKAASIIKGATLHSLFKLPFGKDKISLLNSDTRNSLQVKFAHCTHIFIDEISLVGGRCFDQINFRLQEIRASTEPFGGFNIIAIGDMDQLQPVQDGWIFQPDQKTLYQF